MIALRSEAEPRQSAYRAMFRTELDEEAIGDVRLAVNQNQPLDNSRFYAKIEAMTNQWREPMPRGRPRNAAAANEADDSGQGELLL